MIELDPDKIKECQEAIKAEPERTAKQVITRIKNIYSREQQNMWQKNHPEYRHAKEKRRRERLKARKAAEKAAMEAAKLKPEP